MLTELEARQVLVSSERRVSRRLSTVMAGGATGLLTALET